MSFGQHQDKELWNNQFPKTKILGLPASRRMRDLAYLASRDNVDVDTFHKGIQYALERLGKSKFGFKSTTVSNFKSKKQLVDHSRAPCLGADQKARGLWERDWSLGSLSKDVFEPRTSTGSQDFSSLMRITPFSFKKSRCKC